MSDVIRVVDLEVWARLGVPKEERAQPQRLLVSVEMSVANLPEAARTDEIGKTVDYFIVAQWIKTLAGEKEFHLVETLVEKIAACLLAEFPILAVKVEIKKFALPDTAWISIVIERTRA